MDDNNRTNAVPARAPVSAMSDREIAEETLGLLREFAAVLEAISQSPMARMMPGMPTLTPRG